MLLLPTGFMCVRMGTLLGVLDLMLAYVVRVHAPYLNGPEYWKHVGLKTQWYFISGTGIGKKESGGCYDWTSCLTQRSSARARENKTQIPSFSSFPQSRGFSWWSCHLSV
mmetsp:Transcript_39863/g.78598  ORF Transcript_39863/g.78598 Transcript_39863/m.78598 type:complete len:110 (+) Transcript_39863:1859-2188(+)